MTTSTIRVMLVEDSSDYRMVIEHALETENSIELISQFSTAEIALRSLDDSNTRQVPDLILLDLRLPGMDGLEALTWFRQALPNTKVIILTQSSAEADVLKAIQHGASGYLLKSSSADQVIDGITTVIRGGASLDANVARFVLATLQHSLPSHNEDAFLSERQMEILSLLAQGLSKKEIAAQLSISYSTVNTHVEHIYQRLDAPNAPAAISTAYQTGLLPIKKPEQR